jgi:hypothetical protein
MEKILIFFFPALLISISLLAQDQDLIIVKAGTALLDHFTVSERYLYPEFTTGKVFFKNNAYSERKFNYNYLAGEMEFLQQSDTLSIINKEDIKLIVVATDTFYYDKGYIEQIKNVYPKVGIKQFIELKEIQKKDSYGIASSGGSTISYNSMASDGQLYKLKANSDMVFRRTRLYYISTQESGFVFFNKKNVFQLFPKSKDKIKSYLKTNKIKFDSGDELLKLAEYLETL